MDKIRIQFVIKQDISENKETERIFNNLGREANKERRGHKEEYNKIWEAHKLRNKVVHELKDISDNELKVAYNIFKRSINKFIK